MFSKEILLFLCYLTHKCCTEKISYISTEHPRVDWFDPDFFTNVTLISKRVSRQDPRYYVDIHMESLFTISNNMKADFYFYQFLTNRYRPSFVEMHFTFCNMLHSDMIFGSAIRTALGGKDCPLPPGTYDLANMSIPYVPKGFPFSKGRIYCNVSLAEGASNKLIGYGSIDMEVKEAKINTKKIGFKTNLFLKQ